MPDLTQKELTDALGYDPDTGVFIRRKTGKETGSVTVLGYITIWIYRKQFLAHRLAWLYVHGVWPKGVIDHINQSKTDNRIANLRDVTKSENALNSSVVRAMSGQKGVYYQSNTKKWRAKNGNVHIGYFSSKLEAHQAWLVHRGA